MCYILSDKFPIYYGAECHGSWGSDNFSYGVTASEIHPDISVLEYVFDFAYLWGIVCECCASFVFVRVCVYCGAFCLMFYLVSKFCIIFSGKPLRWAMCRIIAHSLFRRSALCGRLSILSI